MPPRKQAPQTGDPVGGEYVPEPMRPQRSRSAPEALPPVPDDADILAALAEWRRVEGEYRAAYAAMTEARVRLVAVLRAAGVVGFSSL